MSDVSGGWWASLIPKQSHAAVFILTPLWLCNTLTGAVNQQSGLLANQQAPGSYLLGLCSTYVSILFFSEKPRICGIYVTETSCTHRPNLQKYSSACIFYFEGLCVCVFYAQKQTGRVLSECLLAVSSPCGYPRVSVCVQHVPQRCATPRVFKPQEADVADARSSHPTSSVFALHHLPKKKKKQLPWGWSVLTNCTLLKNK